MGTSKIVDARNQSCLARGSQNMREAVDKKAEADKEDRLVEDRQGDRLVEDRQVIEWDSLIEVD